MYINKKEIKIILKVIEEVLSKYSWKDLEILEKKLKGVI